VTGFIVFLLAALVPALISFIVVRRAKRQFSERRRIRALNNYRRRLDREFFPLSFDPLERHSDYIGDISCRNNAKSPYLRCAINPSGPCENCTSYEKN